MTAPLRARIFVDFWNFALGWNEVANKGWVPPSPKIQCDWTKLPRTLVGSAEVILSTTTGSPIRLAVEETIVHASVDDSNESRLREWLTNWLDRQASFDVKIRQRRLRPHKVHCRSCGNLMTACDSCGAPLRASVEKGVDAALVTDLLSLAWQQAYDVAILVSGDADYIPAVEHVQDRGLKVINASWATRGHNLRNKCWGSFDLDPLIPTLAR